MEEEIKQEVKEEIKEPEFPALEQAKAKIAELENLNKKLEDNIKKADSLLAENLIRGKSYAGQNREMTEEEKVIAESKKLLEGTGLNPF